MKRKGFPSSVVIWWIFVSLMWLHTAWHGEKSTNRELWFDEFLYLWCDYIQPSIWPKCADVVVIWWIFVSLMWLHTADGMFASNTDCCDLMNFCIFDVITYSTSIHPRLCMVLWFDEFLYLWCDYIQPEEQREILSGRCDLMNFCIFDVITYSLCAELGKPDYVVIWWIFVSLMWLHTALNKTEPITMPLWFDEFLYLWCDYIQPSVPALYPGICCDLMNFCIFDVITYSTMRVYSYTSETYNKK